MNLSTDIGNIVYHKLKDGLIYVGRNIHHIEKIDENIYVLSCLSSCSRYGEKLFYDARGNLLLEKEFNGLIGMGNNLVAVFDKSTFKWGVLDFTDVRPRWEIQLVLRKIEIFNEFGYTVMYFSKDKGLVSVDKNLKKVLGPVKYQNVEFLTSDLLLVQDDKKYVVINLNGDIIVPVKYKSITMSGEYFIVEQGKYGLLDKTGKCLLECVYDEVIETDDKFVVRDFAKIEIPKTKEVKK